MNLLLLFILLLNASIPLIQGTLLDEAKALLLELNDKVGYAINDGIYELSLTEIEIRANGNVISTKAGELITQSSDNIQTLINNLVDEGASSGVDSALIEKCISTYQPEVTDLASHVYILVTQCLASSVNYGAEFINKTQEQIGTTINPVKRLEIQVELCVLEPSTQDKCLIPVMSAIRAASLDLPAQIKEDVDKTKLVIDALQPTLQACADDRVDSVGKIGLDIINFIRSCANFPTSSPDSQP